MGDRQDLPLHGPSVTPLAPPPRARVRNYRQTVALSGGSEPGGFQLTFLSVTEGTTWKINRPIYFGFTRDVDLGSVNLNTISIRDVDGVSGQRNVQRRSVERAPHRLSADLSPEARLLGRGAFARRPHLLDRRALRRRFALDSGRAARFRTEAHLSHADGSVARGALRRPASGRAATSRSHARLRLAQRQLRRDRGGLDAERTHLLRARPRVANDQPAGNGRRQHSRRPSARGTRRRPPAEPLQRSHDAHRVRDRARPAP